MTFKRPDLADLRDESLAEIERIVGADARLRMGNLNVLAHIVAGAADGMHGHLEWLSRQILPDTCDKEFVYRHASLRKLFPLDAVKSSGHLVIEGDLNAPIVAGQLLVRGDGKQVITTEDYTLTSTTGLVKVQAVEAGIAGNAPAGTSFTFVTPVPGVRSGATVSIDGLANGADVEDVEQLRKRLLRDIRKPSSGGATVDYETWALEVPGVTRAWVYPAELGPGTVTVRFVRDGDPDIIPNADAVEAVRAYIVARCPVTAAVTVVPPIAVPLNFNMSVTPDSGPVRGAVEAELAAAIQRDAIPGGTLLLSRLKEAASIAPGETDHVMNMPSANVTHTIGQIATMGDVVWV